MPKPNIFFQGEKSNGRERCDRKSQGRKMKEGERNKNKQLADGRGKSLQRGPEEEV